jgi:hypothetical protein
MNPKKDQLTARDMFYMAAITGLAFNVDPRTLTDEEADDVAAAAMTLADAAMRARKAGRS